MEAFDGEGGDKEGFGAEGGEGGGAVNIGGREMGGVGGSKAAEEVELGKGSSDDWGFFLLDMMDAWEVRLRGGLTWGIRFV